MAPYVVTAWTSYTMLLALLSLTSAIFKSWGASYFKWRNVIQVKKKTTFWICMMPCKCTHTLFIYIFFLVVFHFFVDEKDNLLLRTSFSFLFIFWHPIILFYKVVQNSHAPFKFTPRSAVGLKAQTQLFNLDIYDIWEDDDALLNILLDWSFSVVNLFKCLIIFFIFLYLRLHFKTISESSRETVMSHSIKNLLVFYHIFIFQSLNKYNK